MRSESGDRLYGTFRRIVKPKSGSRHYADSFEGDISALAAFERRGREFRSVA
jgi:hypothetical protein